MPTETRDREAELDALFDEPSGEAHTALADRLASDEAWTIAYIGRRMRGLLVQRESLTGQRDAMLEHFESAMSPIEQQLNYLDGIVTDLVVTRRERNESVRSLTVLGMGEWKSTKTRGGWDIDETRAYREMSADERARFTRKKYELDTPALRAHLDTVIAPAKVGLEKMTVRERAARLQAVADAAVGMPGVSYRPERINVTGPLS